MNAKMSEKPKRKKPGSGRRPWLTAEERRDDRIIFKVNGAERAKIERMAAKAQLSISDWVRKRAMGEL
jgi:hypothetical protein